MIRNNDSITTTSECHLAIFRVLDAFEDDGTVPVLPEKGNILPGVVLANDTTHPFLGGGRYIVFDSRTRLSFILGSKDGIRETKFCSNT